MARLPVGRRAEDPSLDRRGRRSAYQTGILTRLDLQKSAAAAAVHRLLENAALEQAGARKLRVVDPLFTEWIAGVDAGSEGADGTDS